MNPYFLKRELRKGFLEEEALVRNVELRIGSGGQEVPWECDGGGCSRKRKQISGSGGSLPCLE